jgi:hypothetical protein
VPGDEHVFSRRALRRIYDKKELEVESGQAGGFDVWRMSIFGVDLSGCIISEGSERGLCVLGVRANELDQDLGVTVLDYIAIMRILPFPSSAVIWLSLSLPGWR